MTTIKRERPADYFADWTEREALAEGMIPLVGTLYREHNVKTYLYGFNIHNQSVSDIMKAHRKVRQVEGNELCEFETFPILKAVTELKVAPAHVDIGRLAVKYDAVKAEQSVEDFLRVELSDIIGGEVVTHEPRDVVLYGFGRIGRLMARLLIEKTGGGDNLRLKAIVVRKGKAANDLQKRASLLSRDSVHGAFDGTIRVDEENNSLVLNGNEVKVIYAGSPAEIDYTDYGINNAVVVDNTGVWRDEAGLSQHLKCNGVSKVILTAPGKGDIKNIVYGINNDDIKDSDTIISAASCTTNAISPPLKAIADKFGIVQGHVETVHAYTNDQNLIDNYHPADRRGRSAALNMVITETGAAKAVSKVLPEFEGKLTGNAIRVPTPNVSMAILNLILENETTVDELNEYMRTIAMHSGLRKQIDYSNTPEAVSTDFVGTRSASIYDAEATIVNGKQAICYLWYDNEFGYSCQVHRVLEQVAGVKYAVYPKN
ncbi:MAG: glyceraldehyde-3-phosphate dehydrogenase [Sinobacterium sp.]|nr:glyceraldehyde-3-phosphate dehydrogenase [Sinobacterium sp.]